MGQLNTIFKTETSEFERLNTTPTPPETRKPPAIDPRYRQPSKSQGRLLKQPDPMAAVGQRHLVSSRNS
ncbi:hypothetical protein DdX_01244 [Ditylenchus destructor]|uniref:Uncharacterized protein n=1 Tax=Ditylenchus destructor TaxID=166010 RepID=A0AAD4NL96_9BILA|nr:hypothetical protein DdX_01244 [Ditylenchus destructor]